MSGEKQWEVVTSANGDKHVVPVGDSQTHKLYRQCPCGPVLETTRREHGNINSRGKLGVYHKAYDGRK